MERSFQTVGAKYIMQVQAGKHIFYLNVWSINALLLLLPRNDNDKTYNYYEEAFRNWEGQLVFCCCTICKAFRKNGRLFLGHKQANF